MVDYLLETISKPHNMMVEAFVNRVKVMVCYIEDIPFPGPDPPTISPTNHLLGDASRLADKLSTSTQHFNVAGPTTPTVHEPRARIF
jgi:hypothetical protein